MLEIDMILIFHVPSLSYFSYKDHDNVREVDVDSSLTLVSACGPSVSGSNKSKQRHGVRAGEKLRIQFHI